MAIYIVSCGTLIGRIGTQDLEVNAQKFKCNNWNPISNCQRTNYHLWPQLQQVPCYHFTFQFS